MKKLMQLFTAFFMAAAILMPEAGRAAPKDVAAAGTNFINLLVKEDFAGVIAKFDPTMKSTFPEAKLRELWTTIVTQAGPLQKQADVKISKEQGYNVALITCQFEKIALEAKVVFDKQGRVAGLFFVPNKASVAALAEAEAEANKPAEKTAETPAPIAPYVKTNNFWERNLTVGHGEWHLPGTLTLPRPGNGPWPAVVLVQGSGPQDRDETIGANAPFRDLAWGLAGKGVAVLRYEKRTKEHADKFAASGRGQFTVRQETIDDALSAAEQLRDTYGIDPKRVFVLGHSLGGVVAPRMAQADPKIAGLIILAGCLKRPLEDLMVEQARYVISLNGEPTDDAKAKLEEFESAAAKIKKLTQADAASAELFLGAPPAYWLDLRENDSLAIAKGLPQPMLFLQGGRDYQVPPEDFEKWKKAIGSQPNVTFKLYPRLNHFFMPGEGKSTPAEYEEAGHVDGSVVADIADWIKTPQTWYYRQAKAPPKVEIGDHFKPNPDQ